MMMSLRALALAVPSLALLLLQAQVQAHEHDLHHPAERLRLGRRWSYEYDGHDDRFHKRQGPGTTGAGTPTTGRGGVTVSLPTGASTTTLPPTDSRSSTTTLPTTSLPSTSSRDPLETGDSTTVISTPSSSTTSSTTESSSSSSNIESTTSSTESSSSPTSLAVSTVIVTTTADNGSVLTSASLSTALPSQQADTSSGGGGESNSKKWIIPLSVIGGIILLSGVLLVGYRCTQRRFSEMDDDDVGGGIRWPELLKRNDYEGPSTLNPLGTKRREGAAGFDMDETKSVSNVSLPMNEAQQPYTDEPYNHGSAAHFAAAGLGAPAMAMNRSASSGGNSAAGSTGDIGGGAYYAGPQQGYYDPYLGASGAPYPPPPRVMSPQHGLPEGQYHDPYAQVQEGGQGNYYPPTSRAVSPFGLPPRGVTPPIPAGAVPHRAPSVPLEQQVEYMRGQNVDPYGTRTPASPTLSQNGEFQRQQQQSPNHGLQPKPQQSMRLSIANPDDQA